MRENPWHLRNPSTVHYQWYKNLTRIHNLTLKWVDALSEASSSAEVLIPKLPRVESLNLRSLEDSLDDTFPDDVLGRAERWVWKTQTDVLTFLFLKGSSEEKAFLDGLLNEVAWKVGKEEAKSNWPGLTDMEGLALKFVFQALRDTPFSGFPNQDAFLVRRAIDTEIQVELRTCAHHWEKNQRVSRPWSDRLCKLHSQWMRGYAEALNSRVSLDRFTEGQFCLLKWTLV